MGDSQSARGSADRKTTIQYGLAALIVLALGSIAIVVITRPGSQSSPHQRPAAEQGSRRGQQHRSRNYCKYVAALDTRGSTEQVKRAEAAAPGLIDAFQAQFLYSPEDARSKVGVARALAANAERATSVIVPASPAAHFSDEVRSYSISVADRVQGYSDARFVTTRVVGIDVSRPNDIVVIIEGHHRMLVNPAPQGPGIPDELRAHLKDRVGWVDMRPTQVQLHLRTVNENLAIDRYSECGIPGTPAP